MKYGVFVYGAKEWVWNEFLVYEGMVHNRMELSAHVRENECEYGRMGVLVHGGMEVLVYEVQETVFSSSVELCHSLRM